MPTLILNFKNYKEVLGEKAVMLAVEAERVAKQTGVKIIVAPPIPSLSIVASKVKIPVFCQAINDDGVGQNTGAVVPEAALAAGATGTLLNHSEARIPINKLPETVSRSKLAGLEVCVCSSNTSLIQKLARTEPEYFAIEPPDLIGTGVPVSKARPKLVLDAVKAARESGFMGEVLCGAGISDGNDAKTALGLGVDGILVASSVVKAKKPAAKLAEIAEAMVS